MDISRILRELLNKRGIVSDEEIEEFLSLSPKHTYDPLLLPDMDEGTDLILSEISKGSRIMVYGDYDADGITSTALMLSVLSRLIPENQVGERLAYYIPSRFEEGYGLNSDAIRHISELGYNFIITVDCGSLSTEEVELAKNLGMQILVTDHHTVTDNRADCYLINPKRPDSLYPFKELSGCGVAFKTAQVLQKKAGLGKNVLTEVLDLVAIGTIGDIMPLIDENRTMVKYGLKVINGGSRIGLRKLIEGTGLKPGSISSENVGFIIVPHLNASGRINDASIAVELLNADKNADAAKINDLVNDLVYKNQERKRLQNETFRKCMEIIGDGEPEDFLLIRCDEAHEGIAGIAAGKIKESLGRPTAIVMPTVSDSSELMLKGTSRSIEGIDLYSLLKTQSQYLVKFGGHKGACGFTMRAADFDALKAGLLREMEELKKDDPEIFSQNRIFDLELNISDCSLELTDEIELMAPFGNKNPKPVIVVNAARIRDVRLMGQEQKHVRLILSDEQGNTITCILFNKASEYRNILKEGNCVTVSGYLEGQIWQGQRRLQMIVSDIWNS